MPIHQSFSFSLVVRKAAQAGRQEAEQGVIFPAEKEPPPQSARLIMPDGTMYRGQIVSGKNRRSFQADRHKLTLVFEISHIEERTS